MAFRLYGSRDPLSSEGCARKGTRRTFTAITRRLYRAQAQALRLLFDAFGHASILLPGPSRHSRRHYNRCVHSDNGMRDSCSGSEVVRPFRLCGRNQSSNAQNSYGTNGKQSGSTDYDVIKTQSEGDRWRQAVEQGRKKLSNGRDKIKYAVVRLRQIGQETDLLAFTRTFLSIFNTLESYSALRKSDS